VSRLATSFVLGFHGCDLETASKAVIDGVSILQSDRDYDWLGPGAYFWEGDPRRAWEWALWKKARGEIGTPAVVGAVIDLGNCLDLMSREDIELLRFAYEAFRSTREQAGLDVPRNRAPSGARDDPDKVLRFLDCAVVRHLHDLIEAQAGEPQGAQPFDTVRGVFVEGEPAFPGSGLYRRTHVQIAVRNPDSIKGVYFQRAGLDRI
jgi:hypothetical protein